MLPWHTNNILSFQSPSFPRYPLGKPAELLHGHEQVSGNRTVPAKALIAASMGEAVTQVYYSLAAELKTTWNLL